MNFRYSFRRKLRVKDLLDIDEGRKDRSKPLEAKFITIYTIVESGTLKGKIFKLFKRALLSRVIRYEVKSNSGNKYTVLIKIFPNFSINKFLSSKVQVFCSCADFMYRAAYNLNQTNNIFLNKNIEKHLGIALTEKPTRVDTTPICKHIYAVLNDFQRNYKKYGILK